MILREAHLEATPSAGGARWAAQLGLRKVNVQLKRAIVHQTVRKGSAMATLKQELATYETNLPKLAKDGGKFVLIKQNVIEGIYETYADALNAGYERFKLDRFLVKKIPAHQEAPPFFRRTSNPLRSRISLRFGED